MVSFRFVTVFHVPTESSIKNPSLLLCSKHFETFTRRSPSQNPETAPNLDYEAGWSLSS